MSGCGWALLRGSRDASVLGSIRTIAAAALCGKFASMARALIDPENSFWRNAAGAVAAAILIPIAIVVKLISMPFERQPSERRKKLLNICAAFSTIQAVSGIGTTSLAFRSPIQPWSRSGSGRLASNCRSPTKGDARSSRYLRKQRPRAKVTELRIRSRRESAGRRPLMPASLECLSQSQLHARRLTFCLKLRALPLTWRDDTRDRNRTTPASRSKA